MLCHSRPKPCSAAITENGKKKLQLKSREKPVLLHKEKKKKTEKERCGLKCERKKMKKKAAAK
jgi:hypothetical protein